MEGLKELRRLWSGARNGNISRVRDCRCGKIFLKSFSSLCSDSPSVAHLPATPALSLSFPHLNTMPATRSRLEVLFDTPSSPLAPPSSDSGPQGNTSPPGSPSPQNTAPMTPTRAHGSSRPSPYSSPHDHGSRPHRRITEDLSQVGALAARKLKLKPESMMALEEFSKVSTQYI